MFRFTIRDLLWLTALVAMGAGWWIDQDRIRRQEENLRLEVKRLQTLPLRRAEAVLRVAEADLAAVIEVRQRNPHAVSESELRRLEMKLNGAKLDIETARAREHYTSKR
jgi:hypothetical protein